MITRRDWLGGTLGVLAGGTVPLGHAAASDRFDALSTIFAELEAAQGGRLGVAVLDVGTGRRAGHKADERFPLGSTFKLLASGAILARVDAGGDRLDRRLHFSRGDLVAYSPVTERHADGDGMTLEAICDAAITYSDNTAGNLLLGVLGGPSGLTEYLRGLGDPVTRLDRIEPLLNEATPGDPRDTTTPAAMLTDLQALTVGSALSGSARHRLQDWLRRNTTGDKRLRAKLPAGWRAGEKTGSSDHGTSNDVGLLWPPDGAAPVLVAAFLTEGPAESAARDAILAEIGAAVAAACAG